MACGLPVVASAVGVNTEIVEEGVNGFLATGRDDWIRALTDLLTDTNMRQRFGVAGRKRIEQIYSLQVIAPGLANFLKIAAKLN
jgi:glycosyltransferase involved in cell wall biosynthesis